MSTSVPYLAELATLVEGLVSGRSVITRATPETTDDPGIAHPRVGRGYRVPLLATRAEVVASSLRGRSITTKMGAETTDDAG